MLSDSDFRKDRNRKLQSRMTFTVQCLSIINPLIICYTAGHEISTFYPLINLGSKQRLNLLILNSKFQTKYLT